MATFSSVLQSYNADQAAKQKDDPQAYSACEGARQICAANGSNSQACTAQRNMLMRESIKCTRVGVSGNRDGGN